MGAPKQKWTPEEEAALKAGIARYGIGKWSTILKDPEFSGVLRARSNVDLKDKWRNINVMTNGLGSRQRGKPGYRSSQSITKPDDDALIAGAVVDNGSEVLDVKPPLGSETLADASSESPISRLDERILEAITKLNEPHGSHRAAIAKYIEERYLTPPSFERLLAANLKLLTDIGRLCKVKNQYRIAPSSASLGVSRERDVLDSMTIERNGIKILTKAQIDAELDKIRSMTAQEATAAAAQAVAQAEAAIAEAEAAANEAEEAEAEAEAAQCFAEAAINALNCSRTILAW